MRTALYTVFTATLAMWIVALGALIRAKMDIMRQLKRQHDAVRKEKSDMTIKPSWLCRLGFHDWVEKSKGYGGYVAFWWECGRCGKRKNGVQNIPQQGVNK